MLGTQINKLKCFYLTTSESEQPFELNRGVEGKILDIFTCNLLKRIKTVFIRVFNLLFLLMRDRNKDAGGIRSHSLLYSAV